MRIIIVEKTKNKGGYQARVFGFNPPLQSFAKSEVEALRQLAEKIVENNGKKGVKGNGLYRIQPLQDKDKNNKTT